MIDPTIESIPNIFPLDAGQGSAVQALSIYSNEILDPNEKKRALEHPRRVAEILYAFAGEYLPDEVYDVAALHDLIDRYDNADDGRKRYATNALKEYYSTVSEEAAIYTSCLLSDLELVEDGAENYRAHIADNEPESIFKDIVTNGYEGNLPNEMWLRSGPHANPKLMIELLEEVNLESVLVKAAELLDNLINPASREASVFQDILEAEYFYAPLCETLGFDGFAMALRDVAAQIRLTKSGNVSILDIAEEAKKTAEAIRIEGVLSDVFGIDNFLIDQVVEQVGGKNYAQIGDFVVNHGDVLAAGTWRIKSLGSIGMKLISYGGELPMDVLAMTVIDNDTEALFNSFTAVAGKLVSGRRTNLEPAKSKTKAMYVQGDDAFIKSAKKQIDAAGFDVSEVQFEPVSPDAFHVAKITFSLNQDDGPSTRSEIQFLTKVARADARTGNNSHIAYKANGQFSTESLRSIYDRKAHLRRNNAEVNGQSIVRGLALLDELQAN